MRELLVPHDSRYAHSDSINIKSIMKTNKALYFLTGIFMLSILIGCAREDVRQYAPTESFPADTLLTSVENKRAMIVNAHDDDMCAIAGTISKLNTSGWDIAVVSFSKNPERDEAQRRACKTILDTVIFADLTPKQIRNDNEEDRNSYFSLPLDSFDIIFNKPIIEQEFIKHINDFKPTIVFTLDNEMGGYGHPEHVLISQMVIDLANEKRISPSYIYQSVYTDLGVSR